MTPKEMIDATAAEFDAKAEGSTKLRLMWAARRESEATQEYFCGQAGAYRDAADSLRKLLALKGWE